MCLGVVDFFSDWLRELFVFLGIEGVDIVGGMECLWFRMVGFCLWKVEIFWYKEGLGKEKGSEFFGGGDIVLGIWSVRK